MSFWAYWTEWTATSSHSRAGGGVPRTALLRGFWATSPASDISRAGGVFKDPPKRHRCFLLSFRHECANRR